MKYNLHHTTKDPASLQEKVAHAPPPAYIKGTAAANEEVTTSILPNAISVYVVYRMYTELYSVYRIHNCVYRIHDCVYKSPGLTPPRPSTILCGTQGIIHCLLFSKTLILLQIPCNSVCFNSSVAWTAGVVVQAPSFIIA